MSIRQEIKNLATVLEAEEDAAMDLWMWLPSHQHALEAHGEFAVNFCPSPDGVMREATEVLRVLEGSAAGEPTGLLSAFGCHCEHHDVIPPETTVEKALGRFQPGFRWDQPLEVLALLWEIGEALGLERLPLDEEAAKAKVLEAIRSNRAHVSAETQINIGVETLLAGQRDKALAEAEPLRKEISSMHRAATTAAGVSGETSWAETLDIIRRLRDAPTTGTQAAWMAKERDAARAEVERLSKENSALREAATQNALPMEVRAGRALLALQEQLARLMANPCPSMAFGFGPEDTAKAVTSEVAEILAETVGSEAAKRESAGLLAASVRMSMVQGADPIACMESEADRLQWRLDTMQRLSCTWAVAKAIEADPRVEALYIAVDMFWNNDQDIAAWYASEPEAHVIVMTTFKAEDVDRQHLADCFPKHKVVIVEVTNPREWWRGIEGAEASGLLVAWSDRNGPHLSSRKPK